MKVFLLFELFLCVFCLYALFYFEGETRITVPIICLVTVFLFEMLQTRLKKTVTEVEIAPSIKEKMRKAETKQ